MSNHQHLWWFMTSQQHLQKMDPLTFDLLRTQGMLFSYFCSSKCQRFILFIFIYFWSSLYHNYSSGNTWQYKQTSQFNNDTYTTWVMYSSKIKSLHKYGGCKTHVPLQTKNDQTQLLQYAHREESNMNWFKIN